MRSARQPLLATIYAASSLAAAIIITPRLALPSTDVAEGGQPEASAEALMQELSEMESAGTAQRPAAPSAEAADPSTAAADSRAAAADSGTTATDPSTATATASALAAPPPEQRETRHFSLNLIGATSRGLRGAEASLVFNVERGPVRGAQMAGVFNIATANVHGAQLAGVMNVLRGNLQGTQLAGALNIVAGGAGRAALQGAGALNIVRHSWRGVQAAGAANLVAGELQGVQVAGGFNLASDAARGAQVAGGFNIATALRGTQAAGGFNFARAVSGAQIAGGLNLAGRVRGVQIAPVNLAWGEAGTQVGIVNLAANADAALGVLNFMWSGRWDVEVSGSETRLASLSVRNGARYTHSIYSFGVSDGASSTRLYALGLGQGGRARLSESLSADFDALAKIIYEQPGRGPIDWRAERPRYGTLATVRALCEWQLLSRVGLFAGPSYNMLVSRDLELDGLEIVTRGTREPAENVRRVWYAQFWPGVEAGLRVRLH